jgi:hypothetical protein
MPTLHQNAYFLLQHHVASGYVSLIRSAKALTSAILADRALFACRTALESLDVSQCGILLDYRQAPMSTDSQIQKSLVSHGDALSAPFCRRAILIGTPVGTMQVHRINRTHSSNPPAVFSDELAAIMYLTTGEFP